MPQANMPGTAISMDESLSAHGATGAVADRTADGVLDAIDKSMTEQPRTTLAIALAIGFVLGAIWKV